MNLVSLSVSFPDIISGNLYYLANVYNEWTNSELF